MDEPQNHYANTKKKKANRETQKVDSWLPRDGDRGM